MKFNYINETVLDVNTPKAFIKAELINEGKALRMGLSRWDQIKNKRFKISNEALKQKYLELVGVLNVRYSKSTEKTRHEKKLKRDIKASTKLKVFTSYWIGAFNFDLFLCQVGEKGKSSMKGLVLEVDGSVHDRTYKMSKDQLHYQMLHKLKIGLYPVDNCELKNSPHKYFISKLRDLRRIDHRARQRLLWNIHLFTLCCHLTNHDLALFLGQKAEVLFNQPKHQVKDNL